MRLKDADYMETALSASWWVVWFKPSLHCQMAYVQSHKGPSGSLYVFKKESTPMAASRKSRAADLSFAERLLLQQKQQAERLSEASDDELAEVYPHVVELLTRKLKDGKKELEPASLIVFCRAGNWKAMLSHKSLKLRWNADGDTFKAALEALERVVRGKESQETAQSDPEQ